MKKLLFIFVISTLLPINLAFAAGHSGKGSILHIYQRSSDGLAGVYKEGGNWSNPDGCQNSSRIVLKRDNLSRAEFYSALLAAKMANKEIEAYLIGCVNWNGVTYPVIEGLYTY